MAEEVLSKAKLYAALVKFRSQLEQPKKDATNPYYKQGYVSLTGVQNAIDKAVKGTGLSYFQIVTDTENGNKSVETIMTHESGVAISSGRLTLIPAKKDPQGYGSAITYAKRYQLAAMFGVSSESDDDGNEASKQNYNQQQANNYQHQNRQSNYHNRQSYQRQQASQQPKKPIQSTEQRLTNALNILASMQQSTPEKVKAALVEVYKDTDRYKADPMQALLDGATAMFKEIGEENKKEQGK